MFALTAEGAIRRIVQCDPTVRWGSLRRLAKVFLMLEGDCWVVEYEGVRARWHAVPANLPWAAMHAVQLAELATAGTPELGAGVPADAVELGRQLREVLARLGAVAGGVN
jgi:hypothetical protein